MAADEAGAMPIRRFCTMLYPRVRRVRASVAAAEARVVTILRQQWGLLWLKSNV